jgi:hypothetical protein
MAACAFRLFRDGLQPGLRVAKAEVAFAAIALDLDLGLADLDTAEALEIAVQYEVFV